MSEMSNQKQEKEENHYCDENNGAVSIKAGIR